ncbi:MAG: ferritin-like domain-containing protein [Clostridium sp.]|uniref:ferritin-like domain-containing protein n=1 Tax=Clostridium sp. TaxID=1506 RepID=UPI003D6D8C7C
MLLTKATLVLLNQQISHELNNHNIYRNMQGYFSDLDLDGWASFFGVQAEGEYDHYKHIISYLDDKNAKYEINVSAYDNYQFKDIKEILEKYYATEIVTTKKLYAVLEQAKADNDHGTIGWLYTIPVSEGGLSLIHEQIEEEDSALCLQSEFMQGFGKDDQLNQQWIRTVNENLIRRLD